MGGEANKWYNRESIDKVDKEKSRREKTAGTPWPWSWETRLAKLPLPLYKERIWIMWLRPSLKRKAVSMPEPQEWDCPIKFPQCLVSNMQTWPRLPVTLDVYCQVNRPVAQCSLDAISGGHPMMRLFSGWVVTLYSSTPPLRATAARPS